MHFLYKLTNIINRKCYIGQTEDITKRWSTHRTASINNKPLQIVHRALIKNGVDNFTWEVVCCCKTQDEANDLEKALIKQYNSHVSGNGYNATFGGNKVPRGAEFGKKLSDWHKSLTPEQKAERRKKLSQKRTPEQRAKLSYAQRHNRKNNYTPEMRKMFSDLSKGRKKSPETIEKMKSKHAELNMARLKDELQKGRLKCHAANCAVYGIGPEYIKVDDIRYCSKHYKRLKRNGTLEKMEPYKAFGQEPKNKMKFTAEEIEKIMTDPRGAEKVGKDFGVTEKVILRIRKENGRLPQKQVKMDKCNAPNCTASGGKFMSYNSVSYCLKHASRLKSNGTLERKPAFRNFGNEIRKIKFTPEQVEKIMADPRGAERVGKDFGVSERVILRVRKEHGRG